MKLYDIEDIRKEELDAMPYSTSEIIGKPFSQVVIIPTDDIHESGFRCMKYILLRWEDGLNVVGVIGGYSDVIHLWNGNANIDCLPCGYLRVMLDETATVPYFVGSDFFVERWEKENEERTNA